MVLVMLDKCVCMAAKNLVAAMRMKKKITQEELAEAVGVTRQTIIALEKGNYTPSVFLAMKIAKYFNTRVEKLFGLDKSEE